jgi:hypothetical protein
VIAKLSVSFQPNTTQHNGDTFFEIGLGGQLIVCSGLTSVVGNGRPVEQGTALVALWLHRHALGIIVSLVCVAAPCRKVSRARAITFTTREKATPLTGEARTIAGKPHRPFTFVSYSGLQPSRRAAGHATSSAPDGRSCRNRRRAAGYLAVDCCCVTTAGGSGMLTACSALGIKGSRALPQPQHGLRWEYIASR